MIIIIKSNFEKGFKQNICLSPFFVPFFIRSINDYKMAIIKDIGNIKCFFSKYEKINLIKFKIL